MQPTLWTTRNDLSEQLFTNWQIHYYDEFNPSDELPDSSLVYFRDPFNDPSYVPDEAKIDAIINHYQNAYSVDQIRSFKDMQNAEDKYQQAQLYGDLYPTTWLANAHTFVPGEHIAKPRISQRAKNILFQLDDRVLDDSWIVQTVLPIVEELRVYVISGQILKQASIKSSKSTGSVKVIGIRQLTPTEQDFIAQAMQKCPFDLVGFDLAVLQDSSLRLIEANRSPQFKRYYERTHLNPAELLTESLIKSAA